MKVCREGQVMTCGVTECGYNHMQICQAEHITVGSPTPRCDTFTTESKERMQAKDDMASVRACDITHCSFNKSMSCDASGITVHMQGAEADCLTYRSTT